MFVKDAGEVVNRPTVGHKLDEALDTPREPGEYKQKSFPLPRRAARCIFKGDAVHYKDPPELSVGLEVASPSLSLIIQRQERH